MSCWRCYQQQDPCGSCKAKATRAQNRAEAKRIKDAATFRTTHAHMMGYRTRNAGMGYRTRNAGNNLTLGEEWETSDGYRVRQVEVIPNRNEPGHFLGTIEVIDFAERMKA